MITANKKNIESILNGAKLKENKYFSFIEKMQLPANMVANILQFSSHFNYTKVTFLWFFGEKKIGDNQLVLCVVNLSHFQLIVHILERSGGVSWWLSSSSNEWNISKTQFNHKLACFFCHKNNYFHIWHYLQYI